MQSGLQERGLCKFKIQKGGEQTQRGYQVLDAPFLRKVKHGLY